MRICGKALPPRAALLLTSDLVMFAVLLPVALASSSLVLVPAPHAYASVALLVRLMAVGILCQITFYYNELYNLQLVRSFTSMIANLLQGMGMLLILLGGLYAIWPRMSPGLTRILLLAFALFAVTLLSRTLALPSKRDRVLVIGSGEEPGELLGVIETCPEWNIEVARVASAEMIVTELERELSGLAGHASTELPAVDGVIVCTDAARESGTLNALLQWKMRGVRIEEATNFYERTIGRVPVHSLQPEWFVFSSGFSNGKRKRIVKRGCDLLIAGLLLIATLPIMLLIAIAIYLEGHGPILFMQDRIGLNNNPFRMFKFRSMKPLDSSGAALWVSEEMNRITRLGSILRTFRLDELPQLFNILKGDMSVVGPRPEQPYFCELLTEQIPYYRQRHTVPPGLTGWAQVRYHYGASVEESRRKLEYDLFYVKNLSLWLDLAVLIETVKVVLVGRGAR
jgi:exopolysaccharide biosynthesis polyprenyl glycosylphosphotransferase